MIQFSLPIIGLCAYSGTGKTTLLTQLIPLLKKQDLRIGVVKHAHHKFDIDHPGKDSYEFRQAGAEQVAVASKNRIAWIKEHRDNKAEPLLSDALSALDTNDLDLVIVEGFKAEEFPKIELHRPSLGKPLICIHDKNIIALATDTEMKLTATHHQLDLNDINEIAEFIISFVKKANNKTPVHAVST
ncbi:MAG: molybdopterin-guanine dinucleotide biosynthesis protein B [Gammaproteobacteria bacterium]|nr:molybdopterin-guanine dinucleotide biosynthesis protein B [Gammaproteobacteria bacterium]